MTREERHKKFEEYLYATPAERRKFDMSFLNEKSELDEAAEKKARDIFESLEKHDIGEEKNRVLFGLLELEALALTFSHFGAEWMTAQWETIDGEITTTSDNGWEIIRIPKKLYPLGTKVTVQIRKK